VVVFAWAGVGASGGILGFGNAVAALYCQLLDQQCRETLQLMFGKK
jgi:dihydrodipicolinate synthase/N-acetylneuraminate lyase